MEFIHPGEIERDGQPTGLWHMVYSNSLGIFAVGYCAKACPGHPSSHEATQHYLQWQTDRANFDLVYDNWCGCKYPRCNNPTKAGVSLPGEAGRDVPLCDEHRTKRGLCESLGLPQEGALAGSAAQAPAEEPPEAPEPPEQATLCTPGSYSWALEMVDEKRARARRLLWHAKGAFLFRIERWTYTDGQQDNYVNLPFIAMKTPAGGVEPWIPTEADKAATDWALVD